ncbi:cupin domain-containing protein [Azospirillum sp. RWY-5-1]|uniref:Cupin domain-containing protein n=1 Tax=Azospirillum oleiclasticum TaxID=2735135 RepID=A0ABX2TBZ6_9PROT|nr:cupin domain-containing protein [Azospirillum oleiclasticum]NYZ13532.1 cupin domain-containing protein [Azospirillum oleiclasticum]NYZ20693.1 cupin domain-containing protein [Azospirillum oleiclasticum]
MPALVLLDHSLLAPSPTGPAGFGAVLSGDPREQGIGLFDSDTGRFSAGVWQCTPGVVRMVRWPYNETCVLLSGRVVITPDGGEPREYRAGDAFVIPCGFTGTWDIRETVRKHYAIERPLAPLRLIVRGTRWLRRLLRRRQAADRL